MLIARVYLLRFPFYYALLRAHTHTRMLRDNAAFPLQCLLSMEIKRKQGDLASMCDMLTRKNRAFVGMLKLGTTTFFLAASRQLPVKEKWQLTGRLSSRGDTWMAMKVTARGRIARYRYQAGLTDWGLTGGSIGSKDFNACKIIPLVKTELSAWSRTFCSFILLSSKTDRKVAI